MDFKYWPQPPYFLQWLPQKYEAVATACKDLKDGMIWLAEVETKTYEELEDVGTISGIDAKDVDFALLEALKAIASQVFTDFIQMEEKKRLKD